MAQLIIYNQDNGVPCLVIPAPECLNTHTIMEIALKDVPPGKPFKIIEASELPLDYPQEVWELSDEDLTDGIGGDSNEFN